jgi:hypothetical protein
MSSYDGHDGGRCNFCGNSMSQRDCDTAGMGFLDRAVDSVERSGFGRMRLVRPAPVAGWR